jgi:hypothetical protein
MKKKSKAESEKRESGNVAGTVSGFRFPAFRFWEAA